MDKLTEANKELSRHVKQTADTTEQMMMQILRLSQEKEEMLRLGRSLKVKLDFVQSTNSQSDNLKDKLDSTRQQLAANSNSNSATCNSSNRQSANALLHHLFQPHHHVSAFSFYDF